MSFDEITLQLGDEQEREASAETVIRVENLSKAYIAVTRPAARMWELLTGSAQKNKGVAFALNNLSFELKRGERLGIVGENGSGKSTLLKILSSVLSPSSGTVLVKGRVSALLELGAGFNPELSGRENVLQFCRLHGLTAEEAESSIENIVAFSELGKNVEKPLRSYSSGQSVRLGFACAVHVKPDILIIDEALSVGDAYFQVKCLNKIRAMLDEGVTFIYVTHSADSVRALCNRGLWLENGEARLWGDSKAVSEAYQSEMFRKISTAGLQNSFDDPAEPHTNEEHNGGELHLKSVSSVRAKHFENRVAGLRTGSGELRIDDVMVLNHELAPTQHVPFESELHIRVHYSYLDALTEKVDIGIGIVDSRGIEIIHHSLATMARDGREIGVGNSGVIDLRSKNLFCPGEFSINVGVNTLIEHPTLTGQKLAGSVIDYCVGAAQFEVQQPLERSDRNLWGLVRSEFNVQIMRTSSSS